MDFHENPFSYEVLNSIIQCRILTGKVSHGLFHSTDELKRWGGLLIPAYSRQEEKIKEEYSKLVWVSIVPSEGLKFHFTEITVVMAVKCADLCGEAQSLSLSQPLWLGTMWITLRNESRAPLHLPSTPFLRRPPLPPDSLSIPASGSNPD